MNDHEKPDSGADSEDAATHVRPPDDNAAAGGDEATIARDPSTQMRPPPREADTMFEPTRMEAPPHGADGTELHPTQAMEPPAESASEETLLEPATTPSAMDTQALPSYELGSFLAAGGMADVHIGHDHSLDQKCAIKLIKPEALSGDVGRDLAARFVKEAQIMAKLRHDNIIRVFASPYINDRPAIVMEFLPGGSLADKLSDPSRAPNAEQTVKIMADMANALAYLHKQRPVIVHRDFKPGNIMFTADDSAVLTDFGIARTRSPSTDDANMTRIGTVIGTLAYMAPEQRAGGEVGPAADIFAFGKVLNQLLTRATPTDDVRALTLNVQELVDIQHAQLEHVSEPMRTTLASLIGQCLAPREEERPSAAQCQATLMGLLNSGGSEATLPNATAAAAPPIQPTASFEPATVTSNQEDVTTMGPVAAAAKPDATINQFLEKRLAQGGMSQIYTLAGERDQVIKVPIVKDKSEKELKQLEDRLEIEAKITALVSGHPHVIREFGRTRAPVPTENPTGNPFEHLQGLRLEKLDGETVEEILAAGPMSLDQAIIVMIAMAQALMHLENHNVVHRDFTPNNIFIDKRSGVAKLIDFGLAMHKVGMVDNHEMRMHMGTDGYWSPEQRKDPSIVGPKADIYSFGMVLLRLLTNMDSALMRKLSEEKPNRDRIQEQLVKWMGRREAKDVSGFILSCVQWVPHKRPSANVCLQELTRIRNTDYSKSTLPRLRRIQAGIAVGVLAAAGAGGWFWWQGTQCQGVNTASLAEEMRVSIPGMDAASTCLLLTPENPQAIVTAPGSIGRLVQYDPARPLSASDLNLEPLPEPTYSEWLSIMDPAEQGATIQLGETAINLQDVLDRFEDPTLQAIMRILWLENHDPIGHAEFVEELRVLESAGDARAAVALYFHNLNASNEPLEQAARHHGFASALWASHLRYEQRPPQEYEPWFENARSRGLNDRIIDRWREL